MCSSLFLLDSKYRVFGKVLLLLVMMARRVLFRDGTGQGRSKGGRKEDPAPLGSAADAAAAADIVASSRYGSQCQLVNERKRFVCTVHVLINQLNQPPRGLFLWRLSEARFTDVADFPLPDQ